MTLNHLQTEEMKNLCKANIVKSLFAFGSVVRDNFNEDSDIDLVVDFEENDPFKYTDLYFSLKEKLEALFNRQVDLLEERAIHNKLFRQQLDRTKIKIYG
ncbi:nucleotidyltransferase family protein [Persicitalea jodogahamensis]|uniref:Nucleotidyltransferase n=1 Tax=Persicitalea jodogahamensis TaxID=402147 RepID=A0A8J3D3Z3_9BACT|nr:nucleotidyltransferase domain-containing protein [Persicitalea jodogahamensis]GHB68919.1 nucleotidyltransferase [Persicitalea jodogahamensis]